MSKLRQSKMMWSFLVFGVLLTSIPVLILSAYIYFTSSSAMQENLHVVQRELLDTVREDIEQVIQTVDQQLFDASLVPSTLDAFNASNYKYNYITFDNIRLLKNRMIEMQGLITQRTGVDVEYTVVNLQGEWLQNIDGFYQFTVEKVQDMLGMVRAAMAVEVPGSTPTGTRMISSGGMMHLIRPIRRGVTDLGALAISIPERSLFSRIDSVSEMGNALILGAQGEQIAAYQAPGATIDFAALTQSLPTDGMPGHETIRLEGGGQWVVTRLPSDYLPWQYILATDIQAVRPQSNILTASVIAITASTLLVIAFAFFFFTRRMYRPIARLVQQVAHEAPAADGTDEFTTLSSYIHQVRTSHELLQQVQAEQKSKYTRQFLLQLIDGNIIHDWAVRRADTLGLSLSARYFCLFLLDAESTIGIDADMQDDEMRLVMMRDIAGEMFPPQHAYLSEVVDHRFLMLHTIDAPTPEQARAQAHAQAARLMQVIAASLQSTPRCVIAGPFDDLMRLPDMYVEAAYTLQNRIGIGDDNIGYSTNEGLRKRAYSKEAYRELTQAVARREDAAIQAALGAYFAPLDAAGLPAEEVIFERLWVATNILCQTMPPAFPSLQPLLSPDTDPAAWIFENIASSTSHASEYTAPLSISDMVIALIGQEYQTPLTLEYCADRIGYHPSYVSRMFKQQTGTSFKEYLYLYRIQKSKEMLTQTDLQISEISSLLCYNNAQNFIRVFKKVVGVTPGVYRTEHKA